MLTINFLSKYFLAFLSKFFPDTKTYDCYVAFLLHLNIDDSTLISIKYSSNIFVHIFLIYVPIKLELVQSIFFRNQYSLKLLRFRTCHTLSVSFSDEIGKLKCPPIFSTTKLKKRLARFCA